MPPSPPTSLWASGFRRLLAARLVAQTGDGLFQVGVAWLVLLSPDAQPSPAAFAGALALVLLPFSVVGPFAGVLLDRWSRRQALVLGQLARAAVVVCVAVTALPTGLPLWPAYVLVLVALGLNRVLLAALSAALPHVVTSERLVTANAIAPTAGTIALGTGIGLGAVVLGVTGSSPVVIAVAVAAYVCAAGVAAAFDRSALGPHTPSRNPILGSAAGDVISGLRHLGARQPAATALLRLSAFRLLFGAWTLVVFTLALGADPPASSEVVAAVAVTLAAGYGLAALLTPLVVRRWRLGRWVAVLAAAGTVVLALTIALAPALGAVVLVVQALVFGLVGQTLKIHTDTQVQRHVDDSYLGRAFTVYDICFNVAFVGGALLALAT